MRRSNRRFSLAASLLLIGATACGSSPADPTSPTGPADVPGDPTTSALVTTTKADTEGSLGQTLDSIRSGGANEELCGSLGKALGLGAVISSGRTGCSFDSTPVITVSFAAGTSLESFTTEAVSRGGAEIDICDGGYEVSSSGTYTLGAHDEGRNFLYLINIAAGEDTSDAPDIATAMCTG